MEQFKYLGLQILPRLDHVTKANYESLMTDVNESLQSRSSLPMSMTGRINILKSNVLPKLLYLFQNILLPPPSDLFSELKKCLWNLYGTVGGLDYVCLYCTYHLIVGV